MCRLVRGAESKAGGRYKRITQFDWTASVVWVNHVDKEFRTVPSAFRTIHKHVIFSFSQISKVHKFTLFSSSRIFPRCLHLRNAYVFSKLAQLNAEGATSLVLLLLIQNTREQQRQFVYKGVWNALRYTHSIRRNTMGDIRERKDKTEIPKLEGVYRRISIKNWHVEYFFKIIDEEIEDLLEYDICNRLADKYLIAMVFMYFLRAAYRPEEYTRSNFFAALCLAHDMEEEDDDNRAELSLFSESDDSTWSQLAFEDHRLYLFKRMDYRAVVSRVCCEMLMRAAKPKHSIWQRERHAVHSGANRSYHRTRNVCPNCIGAVSSNSP